MIRLLYFAGLRERLGSAGETLELPPGARVQDIIELLMARDERWCAALQGNSRILAAVNQEMARPDQPLRDGDELALFPPVTGG